MRQFGLLKRRWGRSYDLNEMRLAALRLGVGHRSHTALVWRLQFRFWQGVDVFARWLFARWEGKARLIPPLQKRPARPGSEPGEALPEYLGHGCPGPTGAGPAHEQVMAISRQPSSRYACEMLIAGRGSVADELMRRLRHDDICVHAIAFGIEDCLELIERGAKPLRYDDLPAQAPRFDIVISTDILHRINSAVLARLRNHATVLDLSGPPGSVDHEAAKFFERKVILSPPPEHAPREVLDEGAWTQIRALVEALRVRPQSP